MLKITKMNIFIYGMRGVGIERAKNIVLAGPKNLTIFDQHKIKNNDLTSNFYLKEDDIIKGKNRDESFLKELSKLYVKLDIIKEIILFQILKKKLKIQN